MLETYDMPEFGGIHPYTQEYAHAFKLWCESNNAYYYGRPKEDFCVPEARGLAIREGAAILLLDNLS